METLKNIIKNYKHIGYTLKHKVFVSKIGWKVYKKLYIFHDMDKILIYIFLPFVNPKKISKLHRNFSSHHPYSKSFSKRNYQEALCDWESARFSKPDKPLNAYDTLLKFYPDLYKSDTQNWTKELDIFYKKLI